MVDDLANWSKSYKNQIGIQTAVKRLKQLDVLMTNEKMYKYKCSQQYISAIKLFADCDSVSFNLNVRKFSLMRNFLLFNINVNNANRAGVLSELTVKDFKERQMTMGSEGGEVFIITILYHKTLGACGPAKLVLNEQLEFKMRQYLSFVRDKLPEIEKTDAFFTTYAGTPLNGSSAVGMSISRHSAASGLGHMTSNDCRRSASTASYLINDGENSPAVSTLMNHSEGVAKKVYRLTTKDQEAVKATRFLSSFYDGSVKPENIPIVKGEFPSF